MQIEDILALLTSGARLMEVVHTLGDSCLLNRSAVEHDLHYAGLSAVRREALESVTVVAARIWERDGRFVRLATSELEPVLQPLASSPDLATQTVLEALCRGILRDYFQWANGVVAIRRGGVFPLPDRHIEAWPSSPHPQTTHNDSLLPRTGMILWDSDWELDLDFSFRDTIDEVCWNENRLPRLASIHPHRAQDMVVEERTETSFFGVRPQVDDPIAAIARALIGLGSSVDVVVVPEFCLTHPDDLEELIRDRWEQLPRITVAGSAHHEDSGSRANTCITYLDGAPLFRHSKHYPFRWRPKGAELYEDIAPQERLLHLVCSNSTRMAVVICSDLNSVSLCEVLNRASVNLLLCPSWTPKLGVFGGALVNLATYSQCIGLVANTPDPEANEPPFWALSCTAEVPATAVEHIPSADSVVCGVFDPNMRRTESGYWQWPE